MRERTARWGSVREHPRAREDPLTIDEAIRDLLDVSTDVTAIAVLDEDGAVVASGPGAAGTGVAEAAVPLWAEAARRAREAGAAALEHVVVPLDGGVVAIVEAGGRRAVAVTRPDPAIALLLFDLRTCLGDAFAGPEETQ
jgi:hypothetical protein